MTDRYARSYRAQGYALMEGVIEFPRGWRGDVTARLMGRDSRAQARTIAAEVETLRLFLSPAIQNLAKDLGLRRPMMRTSPVCHAMGFDPHFEGVGPHQDWPALQTSLNAMTVWIPTQQVKKANFPLEIAPKSHLRGLLPATPGEHYSEVDTGGMDFIPVEMNVGDALVFSGFTVHRTRYPGVGKRVAFSHRIEDAADPWYTQYQYSAQSRVIDRQMKWEPFTDEVRKVFA